MAVQSHLMRETPYYEGDSSQLCHVHVLKAALTLTCRVHQSDIIELHTTSCNEEK